MTVKDVLQSLVDDNMVDCEKVGTSNYFWAFPSKALHARKRKQEELQKQVSLNTIWPHWEMKRYLQIWTIFVSVLKDSQNSYFWIQTPVKATGQN